MNDENGLVMIDIAEFLADYDAASEDVMPSDHRNYGENLRRWFYVIDQENPIGMIAAELERLVDAQEWYNNVTAAAKARGSGGGQLTWPLNLKERMGLQLSVFRSFSDKSLEPTQFVFTFFRRGSSPHIPESFANMSGQMFAPLARDFRRHLVRLAESREPELPASDRTVRLDHNSGNYQEAIEAVDRLEELIRQKNDYDDPDDKEQKLAEIAAGRTLLKATMVRVRAIAQVLAAPIQALMSKFAAGLINQAARAAWDKLTTLLGSGWHWPF